MIFKWPIFDLLEFLENSRATLGGRLYGVFAPFNEFYNMTKKIGGGGGSKKATRQKI